MKKSFCEEVLQYYPRISEYEDLLSTFMANFVFNSFLCYTAIMLNLVTIHAIRKTPSLPKTLKTLLLCLAVSDVGVGLLVQPLYISLLVRWIQQDDPGCNTYKTFDIVASSFSAASFFGVVAVSVDRFLAIHLHLRYQELVTHKRVVAVVISNWTFCFAFLPLFVLWMPLNIKFFIKYIFGFVFVLVTTLVYIRIYLAVRHHKNWIQALQVQQVAQNGEMENLASLIKSAVGIFYVYLVFLLCYLPYFTFLVATTVEGPSILLKKIKYYSSTLVFLNSSLNPVIYCLKMRHIRHAIMDILRNMSWLRNRISQ